MSSVSALTCASTELLQSGSSPDENRPRSLLSDQEPRLPIRGYLSDPLDLLGAERSLVGGRR